MKNQFLGPSRVVPFGPSFPFFPTFFSSRFLSSFSFFIFLIFFNHFLIFSCFSFSLFIFLKKKVSSFLFSCISFKYVLLLALVSESNCFLRSRCSMEMWCPDDIGRDSWDWVGPAAWERACFNSPEWGGGSSPVKTEPPQIVLLLLLFRSLSLTVCMSTTASVNYAPCNASHPLRLIELITCVMSSYPLIATNPRRSPLSL